MNVTFYGAAREVTGSCYLVEANGFRLLVDCGMQQGQDEKEDQRFPFSAADIHAVLLTHAHIDHSGRLPLLVREGFKGKIHATRATCDLLAIMLRDSARIQETDAKWENQKGRRAGRPEVVPLYTMQDAEDALKLLVPCGYREPVEAADGVRVHFSDAGHILGSSSLKFEITEGGRQRKIVFSGDIGNLDQPIIRDPEYLRKADLVVMESTYGDRNHDKRENCIADLASIIDRTLSRGGNVIIPSFAVGRTQEMLYCFREMKERGLVPHMPGFQVYVDSPMATEATRVFNEMISSYGDADTAALLRRGVNPIGFSDLHFVDSSEASKALNSDPVPKVIVSSSGMCNAGRVRHHLKHNLWRPECAVVFVGYQAAGTLGRILLDGVKRVKLFGEEIEVRAPMHNFGGLSAHADRDGLLRWIGAFDEKPQKVFVVHGEETACTAFTGKLTELGYIAEAPLYRSVYDLQNGALIEAGERIQKKTVSAEKPRDVSPAYAELLSAAERLMDVVRSREGTHRNELNKFAREILKLAGHWGRRQ